MPFRDRAYILTWFLVVSLETASITFHIILYVLNQIRIATFAFTLMFISPKNRHWNQICSQKHMTISWLTE